MAPRQFVEGLQGQRFPVHSSTTSSFYLIWYKTGWVHTLLRTWRPLPLQLRLKIKMHLLGWLNPLHICATALAAHLAAANTLIMCKTPKTILHSHMIIPCQTSHHTKRLSRVLQFSPFSFSRSSSLSALSRVKRLDTIRTLTDLGVPS